MLFSNENSIKKTTDNYQRLSTATFVDSSVRFQLKDKKTDYSKQFAHIYAQRLDQMRPLLQAKAAEKWGDKYPIKKMADLREDNPEKCVILGTTFVHQKLKPSILREISEETQLTPQPVRQNFADESDMVILEDEVQRIQLLGEFPVHQFVTGIVVAVLGYENDEGKFVVEDHMFYECGPQKPLKELTSSPLLVFVSGLDQSATHDFTMSLELFQQWLYGNLPNFDKDMDFEASNVVRVIVAGNSVRTTMEVRAKTILMRQPESTVTLQAVKAVDDLLYGWSQSVNVDLMPGEFDPSNCMLPQQPMHHCMFPNSAPCGAFKCVTNPYEFCIEDRLILGTSGQNVTNIQKYSHIEDTLDALKSIAKWSILAPTAPDTLPCYPYYDDDPFVIKQCPNILFAGNMPEFKTGFFEGPDGQKSRLICVPSFSQTESVAVVNLRTLECKQLCFKLKGFDEIEM
ncbi:DNA polymerase delta small subunit isoform X2 [Contarinia nasturtii]|uniref:DNA polymerase delta small subunit isoform X2 n=1 Tax=Contarinia nasturtii TaxID=265458 RepID=UPI0012D398ED|nr:DNA polymerase delta small subunit isoform X2 [Contarinia nasturtii]